jgi:hypothetical protein
MGVSAHVQLPAGDVQAQQLASAMRQPQPGSPARSQPSLRVAVGNAAMMRGARVEVPPSARGEHTCPWSVPRCLT